MTTDKLMNVAWTLGITLALTMTACDAGESSDSNGAGSGTPTTSTPTSGDDDDDDDDDPTGGDGTDSDDDPTTGDTSNDSDGAVEIDPQNMIDDLEDGDPLILAAGDRRGAWYTYNDETEGAMQSPPTPFEPSEGGPASSLYMAQTSGSGFTLWGAGVGVDLNNEGDPDGGDGMRMAYDASAHSGIAFWARGNAPIRVKLLIDAIVPTDTGGSCATDCEDAHGKIIPLTEEWAQYTVGFDEVLQEGWGTVAGFDASTLMSVQFQVSADTDFDFSLDEIGFY